MLGAALAAAAILAAAIYARHTLGTTYKMYDDEGYVLLSLDHYLAGGHLYTEVFSQYGPFYFFAQSALFRLLHLPLTHDGGRLATLILWLISAALGAWFVHRVSRSLALATAAGLACLVLVRDISFEPGHPQQWILPMLMLACCAATFSGSGFLVLGALGAALVFTKINVGVFYFAAVALALACALPAGRIRSAAAGILVVFALGCPWLLMRQAVPGPAAGFVLIASVCGASTFLASALTTQASPRPLRDVLHAAAGAAIGAALIVAGTVQNGMSIATLLDGVVFSPLRHPSVYSVILGVLGIQVIAAALVTGFVLGLYRFRPRWQQHSDWVEAVQCVVGLCAIPLLAAAAKYSLWVLPFLPLVLLRARNAKPSDALPRVFVAALAAMQFLQIYPVAGTQIAIAAAPLLLGAFVCVHDGAGGLVRLLRKSFPLESAAGVLLTLGILTAMIASGDCSLTYSTPPSLLRGAASLHLPADREAGYRYLAAGLHDNCDILFTLPGMGSFNYWSGVPAPNGWNLTAWVKGFSRERQQQILDILKAHPKACAVYSGEMAAAWGSSPEELDASPLARYIIRDMPKVAERAGYQIRVHPERNAPWVTPATP